MCLYELPMFMSLLRFGMGIMFTNFQVCGMMLFNAMLYMWVWLYVFLLLHSCLCV